MSGLFLNTYAYVFYTTILLLIIINLTKRLTKIYILKNDIEPHRRKIILNVSYILYYTVFLFTILLIVGANFKEVAVFGSSVLAVLGVGFFAQWSLLSNLTASIILFFYHPIRIGDTIRILDKEFDLTGEVKDITGFYVVLYISESERLITIPNTVVLYKGIEFKKNLKSKL